MIAKQTFLRYVTSRGNKGQAITEMVIMLPTLLILFLGLIYLREMNDTRMRAIEAARYVTWEGVWYVRGISDTSTVGTIKSSSDFRNELTQLGLARYLVDARANRTQTLGNYVSTFTATGPKTGPLLGAFAKPLMTPPFVGNAALQSFINSQSTTAQSLLNLIPGTGTGPFAAQDFFANNTKWNDEASNTIYAARVVYQFGGAGLFGAMPKITMVQYSNLLSHAYNVERNWNDPGMDDDTHEWNEMFDSGGRTFDLFLGPMPPIVKDMITLNFLPKLPDPPFGSFNRPTTPNGTLKEYPELNIND